MDSIQFWWLVDDSNNKTMEITSHTIQPPSTSLDRHNSGEKALCCSISVNDLPPSMCDGHPSLLTAKREPIFHEQNGNIGLSKLKKNGFQALLCCVEEMRSVLLH